MTRRLLLSLLTLLAIAMPAMCRVTAEEIFINAPQDIFMLLNKNARLDMLDYYKAGQTGQVKNSLKGTSNITSLKPESMVIQMTPSSAYQLTVLPASKEDNDLIALIVTVSSPARDSRISFYKAKDWSYIDTKKIFPEPMLADWLSESGKQNRSMVEAMVPFMMSYYTYSPETGTLTVTNDLATFLSPDIYSMIQGYLLPQLVYKWNGKKFSIIKQ